jgi:small-conductance mechanosensitive channel
MADPAPFLLRALQEAPAGSSSPLEGIRQLVTTEGFGPLVRVGLLVVLGFPVLMAASRWIRTRVSDLYTEQRGLVVSRLFLFAGASVLVIWILDELGFGIAPLLGAAGVLGIALGFASQTSVSNIISGLFLMAEQPFVVGDIIQIGTTVGIVQSIDLLSVKLRTFDNKFVRIPNESLIKTEVVNVTRYPIRRLDVAVGVAYKEDVDHVRRVLREVADANPMCLMEPAPMVMFEGYGESSLNFTFRVWATRENWLELKNTIHEDVKDRFDEEGIEIPFPHRTLYTGLVTDPFPVRVVGEDTPGPGGGDAGAGGREPGGPDRGTPPPDRPTTG